MVSSAGLEECEILFHDGTFQEPDEEGRLIEMSPCFCLGCGRVWVPDVRLGLLDRLGLKLVPGLWQVRLAFKLAQALQAPGPRCPFCKQEKGHPFGSPAAAEALRRKRREWFKDHPVAWDAATTYHFRFRSGHDAWTLADFLAYAAHQWDVASWHFAEGHMEPWLRSVGRKDLAAMMRSSRAIQGNGREGFDHWRGRLKEYGALSLKAKKRGSGGCPRPERPQ